MSLAVCLVPSAAMTEHVWWQLNIFAHLTWYKITLCNHLHSNSNWLKCSTVWLRRCHPECLSNCAVVNSSCCVVLHSCLGVDCCVNSNVWMTRVDMDTYVQWAGAVVYPHCPVLHWCVFCVCLRCIIVVEHSLHCSRPLHSATTCATYHLLPHIQCCGMMS